MTEKTKNILKGIGFAVCILAIIVSLPIMSIITVSQEEEPKPIAETRIIEATVHGVNTEGTNVLFWGNDGNLWSADVNEPMYKGQKVMIELSSNGTEQIEDDEILNVWLT